MSEISTQIIKEAIYKLCYEANTCLNDKVYSKVLNAYNQTNGEEKQILKAILQNAKIAYENKMPLCQDTGQVIVFVEIGQNVKLTGEFIEDAINSAVEECYCNNYFRKSVVKNAVFDRENTKTNTPCIIYTNFVQGDEIKLQVLIKGAGSENKSKLEMMLPTSTEEDIVENVGKIILSAGENACPPMFVGIGIGATADKAFVMSKKALLLNEEDNLGLKIKNYVNSKAPDKYKNTFVLDAKVLTDSTHIACMPVAVTINCHSERFSSCTIKNEEIIYEHKTPNFIDIEENSSNKKNINTKDIEQIRELKQGEEVLLNGEIYVARDMAHKKLFDLIQNNKQLPIDIKDKIIFYAGPCPKKEGQISNSIGPTTASRMDKFAPYLYNNGLLATIGKGNRSEGVIASIKANKAKYFSVQGGVAAFLSEKIEKSEIIAFEELGAEAIYKLEVKNFPVKVEIA